MPSYIKQDNTAAMLKKLSALVKRQVLIGVPESEAARDGDEISNAAIGYINETGSPANNIPPRPHLVPGVESVQDKAAVQLRDAAAMTFGDQPAKAEAHLEQAGMLAQAAVRAKITDGPFEPLSDSTLRARARRGRIGAVKELAARKKGDPPDNSNARPLIDTGQYRRSITFAVRTKK